ncbi:hypothetical protein D3C80_2211940 [compost metagenome]
MSVIVDVRATDTHGMNGDAHHAGPDLERQFDITQSQFVLALQNQGADFGHVASFDRARRY